MEYLLGTLALALALRSLMRLGRLDQKQQALTAELEQARLAFLAMQQRVAWLENSRAWAPQNTFTPPAPAAAPMSETSPPPVAERPSPEVPAPEAAAAEPKVPQPEPAEPSTDVAPTIPPTESTMALETWLGARGAALLGAALLVLAGMYFFRYSIEHGYLTAPLRVGLGALTGTLSIVGAERLLRRRHELLANGLTGAGVAILYITTWAAFDLYHLIDAAMATVALIGITAAACALSAWRRSSVMATMGLLGGFATPVMLSTGEARPVALFAYLLLLDAGLLALARRHRWPGLALACLIGTAGYEWAWSIAAMGPDALAGGMIVFALFAAAFAVGTHRRNETLWRITRVLAVALPFGFALFLGAGALVTTSLPWLLAYLGLLLCGAFVLTRLDHPAIGPVAAVTAYGVVGLRLSGHPSEATSAPVAILLTAFTVGLSLIAGAIGLVPSLRAREEAEDERLARHQAASPTVLTWALGGLVLIATTTVASPVVGIVAMAALTGGLIVWGRLGRPSLVGAVSLGVFGLTTAIRLAFETVHGSSASWLVGSLLATTALTVGVMLRDGQRRSPEASALAAPILGVLAVTFVVQDVSLGLLAFAVFGLIALALVTLTRHGRTAMLPTATTFGALAFAARVEAGEGLWAVAAVLAVLSVGHLWPAFMPAPLRREGDTWRAAGIGAALGLPILIAIWHAQWGSASLGVPALVSALATSLTLAAAEVTGPIDLRSKALAREWLGGVAFVALFLALTLQLSGLGLTVGYALLGLGTAALWRRHDHGGVAVIAASVFALVFARLLLDPGVLTYAPRSGVVLFNWIALAYGIPMAAALGARRLMQSSEHPLIGLVRSFLGGGAVVLGFCWLNLAIVDAFATGATLTLPLDHRPGRDLTLSIGWALYALVLLGVGLRTDRRAPRTVGLGLMVLTCAKVFFIDLAHLEDLYRVSSLVGLSLALIAVSLGYQRLVAKGLGPVGAEPAPPSSR